MRKLEREPKGALAYAPKEIRVGLVKNKASKICILGSLLLLSWFFRGSVFHLHQLHTDGLVPAAS